MIIKSGYLYYGKKNKLRGSSTWREVVSVTNDTVVYIIGRSYGSDERECSLETFKRWARRETET